MHRHRPTLKQQNKEHKTGKHSTKSEIKKNAGGKVEKNRKPLKQVDHEQTKLDRRNKNRQIAKHKAQTLVAHKRSISHLPKITVCYLLSFSLSRESCLCRHQKVK